MITFRDILLFPNRKGEDRGYGYRPDIHAMNIFIYRGCVVYADFVYEAVATFNMAFRKGE